MKQDILNNLENPKELESIYRTNAIKFKKEFELIFPSISGSPIAQVWQERLTFENQGISWGGKNELWIVIGLALFAGLIAKLQAIVGIDTELYYSRNLGFIVFPALIAYFTWKLKLDLFKVLPFAAIVLFSVFYINLLPKDTLSDTLVLACIHLPLLLWAVLGYTFTGLNKSNLVGRINFLRFNGELVVVCAVILIAGGILSGITVGLFELINLNITEFYFSNIAIVGVAAVPVIGTYLVQSNPHLVKHVSPIIAKVFTPLVLIMLVAYLIAMIYTQKDPYTDREFLIIFNLLLIGVMAIILFSVSETSKTKASKSGILMLFLLSVLTVIINGIALSAILYRISEWGITPNRVAVLGANLLILSNLLLVTFRLFKSLKDANEISNVETSIAKFLPIYTVWTMIVVFLFPLVFMFK